MSERPDSEYEWEDVIDEPNGESHGEANGTEPTRRGFLVQFAAAVVGAIATLVPAVVGLFVVTGPIRRDKGGAAEFLPIAKLDAVPADGLPRAFPVIKASVNDAWNRYHNVPVGSVYLIRAEANPDQIKAFNTTCPHLGCYVDRRENGTYHCPCHDSEFNADGSRGAHCVSPRGLDALEAKVEGEQILVQFKNYKTGVEEQIELR